MPDMTASLEFGPILRSMGRNKIRIGLVVLEIGLTLAIVVTCVSLILDARGRMLRYSGFDDANLLSVRSTPFDPAFKEDGYLDNSRNEDLRVLRSIPGVVNASNTRFLPWQGGGSSTALRPAGSQGEMLRTQIYNADEGTLDTLGVRLLEGRNFTREEVEADVRRLRPVLSATRAHGDDGLPKDKVTQDVIVSQAYGKLVFGDQPLLGKRLEDSDGDMYRIIGVFDSFYNPYGWPIHEYAVFFMYYSRSYEGGAAYLVRTEPGRTAEVAGVVEQKLLAANNGRNMTIRTVEEVKGNYFGPQRIMIRLMTGVVFLLVFVTSLGIVGLTSFSVTERTRHIGTRRALGARQADILRHFLVENWLVTTLGLALGVAAAYGLNFALMSAGSGPRLNPALVLGGVLLLWGAGLLATLAPALRAARISPAIATRNV